MMTAILIHGCHLQAKEWKDIVWGEPSKDRFGRVPRALELMATQKAKLLIWGTGASAIDGVKEAAYTFNFAVTHAAELPAYSGLDPYEIEAILKRCSFIDTETQDTPQEIERAGLVCQEREIRRLIVVSSPTHISRCLLEAEILREAGKLGSLEVLATASDISYAGSTPKDVVIIEPPHRGDRPDVPIYKNAARLNKFRRSERVATAFNDAFGAFLDEWEQKL